jgi:hypothetical protein
MQEMHKGKLYICYKGAPTHQLKKSNKHHAPPASEWKLLDLGVWWKYQLVGHVSVHGSMRFSLSLATLSLRKWYLTSMCLVLEWNTRFFATLMALVLSHWSGTWVYSSPKSLMVYAVTYSASVVDWATLDCLREDQYTKEEPKNWQVPEVDFLSNRHPTKCATEITWGGATTLNMNHQELKRQEP